jgi:2-polyprenyl-3-methyl-5-hydroxy-6-metoxy-1,4-benzoquinol methylase
MPEHHDGTIGVADPTAATQIGAELAQPANVPDDSWLRGYFARRDVDVQGGDGASTGVWKNMDFLRLRDVALHLLEPGPGKTVLDIGCADGATMIYCGLQGACVYGQDLDPVRVASANTLMARFRLSGEARHGDATVLTFPDNFFDGVISSDFMEHISDETKVKVLTAARRVLKPGGILVTKTPNLSYLRLSLLYKRLRAVAHLEDPNKYVIPHTPGTDDPQHIGLATRWSFTRCLTAAGFLNYHFHYAPLRRFGPSTPIEVLSTEIPVLRDLLCEDLFCRAYKPIAAAHFPD